MVIILEGISEKGVHGRSSLCYLICSRHLIRSRVVTNFFISENTFYRHACATCSELPSIISTMVEDRQEDRAKIKKVRVSNFGVKDRNKVNL